MNAENDKAYKLYSHRGDLYIIKHNIYRYFKAANTTQWIPYTKKTKFRPSRYTYTQPPEYIKDITENELFMELL